MKINKKERILIYILLIALSMFIVVNLKDDINKKINTRSEKKTVEVNNSLNKNVETKDEKLKETVNGEYRPINGKIVDKYEKTSFTEKEKNDRISQLPQILQEKIRKYPESMNTILNFQELKDKNLPNDMTWDMENSKKFDRKVKMPYINQWDERWAFEMVDNMYIAVSGCGPTNLSMIYAGLTGDLSKDPVTMAKYAFENGWYTGNGGQYDLFIEGPRSLGLKANEIDKSVSSIKAALDRKSVVVALVRNFNIGDFTIGSGHYILLSEYENDNLKIYDVNSYKNTNKLWTFDRILSQTVVLYEISK